MAGNLAQKRALKAQKRKLAVAEKRKAEALEASLPAQVLRASRNPIQHCLINAGLFDSGIGSIILARGETPSHVAFGSFLVDVFCLGIKNVMFSPPDSEAFEKIVDGLGAATPLVPVEPSHARKLLRELGAWSFSIGFPPHKEFATVESLFGDVSAEASDTVFHFGLDGRPHYVPGPYDSPQTVRRRIEHLSSLLGEEGFSVDLIQET